MTQVGRQKRPDMPLANERIRFDEVQLIDQEGKNYGVLSRHDALRMAQDAHLDLVLIAERGGEGYPVVKIIDLGKMLYEKKKQQGEARKKQHVIQIKEVKIRPKIAEHDFQTKMRQVLRFLEEGKHARITLTFRGREMTMRDETGKALFDRIKRTLENASLDGHTITQESETIAGGLWSRVYALKK